MDDSSACEQKLRLYETQAKKPELSAALIATISKLNLMDHHIIQRVVALSSGLITNGETKSNVVLFLSKKCLTSCIFLSKF
jgi:hypothetical protein